MKKVFVFCIIMFVAIGNNIAQETYVIDTEHGLKFEKRDTLAKFLGSIPLGISPEQALEAYQNKGKPVIISTDSKSLYNEYAIWITPILITNTVIFQNSKLVPQKPIETPENRHFAERNLLLLMIAILLSFISTRFFDIDDWKDKNFNWIPIGLFIISLACLMFIVIMSPGSNILYIMIIGTTSCSIASTIGFIIREKYIKTIVNNIIKKKSNYLIKA